MPLGSTTATATFQPFFLASARAPAAALRAASTPTGAPYPNGHCCARAAIERTNTRNAMRMTPPCSETSARSGLDRGPRDDLHAGDHPREALVLRQALHVALVDLLRNHRELELRKAVIEEHSGDVASGEPAVPIDELRAREAARE